MGAVTIDLPTNTSMVYSGEVPSLLKDSWVDQLGEHIICQLELNAMVALRWSQAEKLSGRRVIWWVDNEAARYALIKGQSLSQTMNVLVREFYDAESSHSSYGWIERVPSYSNVAGDPSHGRPERWHSFGHFVGTI